MLLYHYTNILDVDSFVEKGLIFGSELDNSDYEYNTGPINGVLEKYKPTNMPSFIDRNQCIFFYPKSKFDVFWKDEIKVNSKNLLKEKLYVANLEYAQQIWEDTVHYSFSDEHSGIPLQDTAKKYWESLLSFDDYLSNPQKIKSPEVLYFEKIPFDHIEIFTSLDGLSQEVFRTLKMKYKVERTNNNYGKVYLKGNSFLHIDLYPSMGELIFQSNTGYLDEKFFSYFESQFNFNEKEIDKSEGSIKFIYKEVKRKTD